MPLFHLLFSWSAARCRPMAIFLAFLLFAGGCAGAPVALQELPAPEQKITIRVLDSRDRPVVGARITFTPQAGRPRTPGPFLTDQSGQLTVSWQPQSIDETKGTQIGDQLVAFVTRTKYLIQAEGFMPISGVMQGRDSTRRVVSPILQSLSRQAALRPLAETVVLRSRKDLLGGDLANRPLQDPLVARCLAFEQSLGPVVGKLGCEFAWPAFVLKGSSLSLHFAWKGVAWGGLDAAPITAKVVVSAGMPLALACGEELVPLPGVNEVSLKFLSEILPANDPYALPQKAAVVLSAPAQAYQALARGKMAPDQFLLKYPPRLQKDRMPSAVKDQTTSGPKDQASPLPKKQTPR